MGRMIKKYSQTHYIFNTVVELEVMHKPHRSFGRKLFWRKRRKISTDALNVHYSRRITDVILKLHRPFGRREFRGKNIKIFTDALNVQY